MRWEHQGDSQGAQLSRAAPDLNRPASLVEGAFDVGFPGLVRPTPRIATVALRQQPANSICIPTAPRHRPVIQSSKWTNKRLGFAGRAGLMDLSAHLANL